MAPGWTVISATAIVFDTWTSNSVSNRLAKPEKPHCEISRIRNLDGAPGELRRVDLGEMEGVWVGNLAVGVGRRERVGVRVGCKVQS